MLGGVDQDIDAGANSPAHSSTEIVSVRSSATISTRSIFRSFSSPGNGFQGSAMPTKTTLAPASRQSLGQRLAHRGAAVGDQHAAKLGIAGELAPLRVVGHVRGILRGQRHGDRLAGLVELQLQPGPLSFAQVAMEMRHDRRAGIERHGADAPRHALAEIDVGRGTDGRLGEQRAAIVDVRNGSRAERQRGQASRGG